MTVEQVIAEFNRRDLLQSRSAGAVDCSPLREASRVSPRERSRRPVPAARGPERRQEHAHVSVSMAPGLSRRELLSGGVTKAVLAAPVISTFFAADAYASGIASADCRPVGFSCESLPDCCDEALGRDCQGGVCCIEELGTGCVTDDDCCPSATGGCVGGTCAE